MSGHQYEDRLLRGFLQDFQQGVGSGSMHAVGIESHGDPTPCLGGRVGHLPLDEADMLSGDIGVAECWLLLLQVGEGGLSEAGQHLRGIQLGAPGWQRQEGVEIGMAEGIDL